MRNNNQIKVEIIWDTPEIDIRIRELALKIIKNWGDAGTVNLVPIMTGAICFGSKLLIHLESLIPDKWVVNPVLASAYSDEFNPSEPEIVTSRNFEQRMQMGFPTIILDDLIDTGVTLIKLKNKIKSLTNGPVEIAVLVDKKFRRQINLEANYSCFKLNDDKWLVGYGMDYKGKMRGMDKIGYIIDL